MSARSTIVQAPGFPIPPIRTAVDRVICEVVKVAHLPPGLRFDYLWSSNRAIVGQEWVCPDGPDIIGELGRQWWMERASRVPGSIEEAYDLARRLPRPKEISVKVGSGCIESIVYPDKIGFIDGKTSLFYSDIDRFAERQFGRDLKTEQRERKAGRHYGASLLPAGYHGHMPAWWRSQHRRNTARSAILDPLDRHSMNERQQSRVRATLNASRRQWKIPRLSIAISNICMAYTIAEPPIPEELFSLMCYDLTRSEDPLVKKHQEAFIQKLRAFATREWLDGIVEPRLNYLRSLPPQYREHVGFHLGIGMGGRILPANLAWDGERYDCDKCRGLPCIDVLDVFSLDESKLYLDVERLPSFVNKLRATFREAINQVRTDLGLPRIGEGWTTETDLFNRVKALLPAETVIHQGQPAWLSPQRFDIWIPGRKMAIEYHGEQHFSEITFFGGLAGLKATQERDAKKRGLCLENGVELVEIAFNEDRSDEWLISRLRIG